MQIKYEKHPVTAERKAQLRAQGFKIVDARFAPDNTKAQPQEITRESIATMKRAEVIEQLEAHGLSEADCEGQKLPELRAILTDAVFI